jgi:hypothetical protein
MAASSPTPVDPVRKRSSLQLTTSPPLLVSVGSSPTLESAGKVSITLKMSLKRRFSNRHTVLNLSALNPQ